MPGAQQQTTASHFDITERDGTWLIPASRGEEVSLRSSCRLGEVFQPMPGCFARRTHADALSPRGRALADVRTLSRLHPAWAFCSFSAALLHGLQLSYALLDAVHVLTPTSYRRTSHGVVRHSWRVAEEDIVLEGGVRTTSVRRTLLDCLCACGLRQGLALADSALHWELASKGELEAYFCTAGHGMRGIRQARETLAFADGRAENGGESTVRAIMIELGFAVPELQVPVFDPMEPENEKRADFGWELDDGTMVLGELDGLEKYRAAAGESAGAEDDMLAAFQRERLRESHLSMTDARIVRFSYRQALDEAYFARLLAEAGVPRVR